MASLRTLDDRVYPVARWFVSLLEAAGFNVTVTSARRDLDQQRQLYAAYRSGRSRYPAAPPGHSTHGLGIAFDLNLRPPRYDVAGAVWEALGFTWGGRFGDRIHFDFRPRVR